jgi:excisionase family DNA binding protein
MADGVTVAEAAAILGVSVDVVRKRLQRGTLAGEKQGRTWLVTLRQDATGHRQDTQKPSSRETVSMTGQPTGHRQDTDRTRQDMFDELLDCDPALRAAVLEATLRGTLAQLAAARDEAQFLRERLAEKDSIISRLSEAQVEALRRRDILAAQERKELAKPASSSGNKAWWQFWR